MKMQVLRLNGQIINIGPWDHKPYEVVTNPLPEVLTGAEEPLEDGSYGMVFRHPETREVIDPEAWDLMVEVREGNPMPEGAVWSEEEIERTEDGGLRAKQQ